MPDRYRLEDSSNPLGEGDVTLGGNEPGLQAEYDHLKAQQDPDEPTNDINNLPDCDPLLQLYSGCVEKMINGCAIVILVALVIGAFLYSLFY